MSEMDRRLQRAVAGAYSFLTDDHLRRCAGHLLRNCETLDTGSDVLLLHSRGDGLFDLLIYEEDRLMETLEDRTIWDDLDGAILREARKLLGQPAPYDQLRWLLVYEVRTRSRVPGVGQYLVISGLIEPAKLTCLEPPESGEVIHGEEMKQQLVKELKARSYRMN